MENFTTTQTVQIDGVLVGGASTFNIGAPYFTIPAGRYRIIGFMQQIALAVRNWLHARINEKIVLGTFTLVGTLPNVSCGIILSNQPNETRVTFSIDKIGRAHV